MKPVFADSGHWIAIINPAEILHERALQDSRSLGSRQIVTSEVVLTEVLDFFASFGSRFRERAVELVRQLQADPQVTIAAQTSILFEQALDLYANRKDKE